MSKKASNPETLTGDAPFREDDDNALPAFAGTETSSDESLFKTFEEVGETFDGMFIRNIAKGTNDLEYPASLYAEYPSGKLRLLPYGFSMGEEQTKQDDKGRNWTRTVQRITLTEIKTKDEGTKKEKKVKLYQYAYMTLTEAAADKFAALVKWSDAYPQEA
jgi:hypothetical protein